MMAPTLANISVLAVLIGSLLQFSNALSVEKRGVAVSTNIPAKWAYFGCQTDSVGARTLSAATYADTVAMTEESCITFCNNKGYIYAGVEYMQECYCGNSFLAGAAAAPIGDCNMACTGNAAEACGGPNRLTVFNLIGGLPATGPVDDPGVGRWTSIGCYTDSTAGRTLTTGGVIPGGPAAMSVALCTASCQAANFKYSGVEYAGECYCGNTFSNGGGPAPDGFAGCNMPCNGNSSEFCGGPNRLNMYQIDVPPPTGWVAQGCYTDSVGARTLTVGGIIPGGPSAMSHELCYQSCQAAGYIYSGTEYSGECYCDNTLHNGGGPAPDGSSGCNMPCNGAPTEMCGGANRLNLYKYNAPSSSSSISSSSSAATSSASTSSSSVSASVSVSISLSTSVSSSSASASTSGSTSLSVSASSTLSSTSATPTPKYQGCWQDNYNGNGRSMGHGQPDSVNMTVELCTSTCTALGYSVSGLEYSTQCFCDNYILNGAVIAPDTDCAMPCGGNSNEICGGPNRLSVYSNNPITVIPVPIPQTTNLPGSWTYQGCYTDNGPGGRAFPYQIVSTTNNSATSCLSQCSAYGFPAAGMEYGQECYCGDWPDLANTNQTLAPSTDCSTPCTGDPSHICGAGNRLSAYSWTGPPLATWSYPTGNAAGSYEFLIGGVVIPLITQVTITGKVVFTEKTGTGPPNSTGSYEFDPFFEGDFNNAWRALHPLTDVFCSGSVTLPDKAGRILNVGGWSGVSTYGVRLYWPDGSLGVPGVNDWQENDEILTLQAGRWYPGVMLMTNGSILVVGGEDGSNGAPVPSLEILPTVGPVKQLDYLARTDPYNLYPFLCVLPSGGIAIFYYNEARILDEVTLDTIQTLPDMPGAVNRPLGGRTYPLEGTMMLLPQVYPYTDPLTVIVCGGSTPFEGAAIDNCITIAPDAPNPQWTIERMPSSRVMSCMTALPDGTYLILNGAHIGYAGFGLASAPNHNAVLYDPSKPVNQRMSVMANTTIDRLYHSEAILMQDGSVLVSGSDPETPGFDQEYRVEKFLPPYLLSGITPPTWMFGKTSNATFSNTTTTVNNSTLNNNTDWSYGHQYSFTLGAVPSGPVRVSLMAVEASTHGNSMGQRTLFPQVSCNGLSCTVTAPPSKYIAPPAWYQMFVLVGPTPSRSVFVRIGGDVAGIGNWPAEDGFFKLPGV